MQVINGLNIYDILEPCYHSPFEKQDNGNGDNNVIPNSFKQLGQTEKALPVRKRIFGRAWPFRAPVREGHVPSWPEIMSNFQSQQSNVTNDLHQSNSHDEPTFHSNVQVPCFVSYSSISDFLTLISNFYFFFYQSL